MTNTHDQTSSPASNSAPQPAYVTYAATAPQRTNVLAIISLVTAFCISLAAVITGHIALAQIKKTGEKGRGLAIAGLVLGYAGIAFGALFFVLMIVGAIVSASSAAVYNY